VAKKSSKHASGVLMERFEELITGRTFAGNGTIDSIGDLEKGAFERGLPAKGETTICSVNHGVRNHISPNQPTSEQGQLNNTPPLILLIDDEAPFRSVIKQVLQNAGYDVVEAADGAEGIRYFHEKPADMIITDIIMPEKEGIETIIELKEAYPAVKMIAMSGGGWYGTDIDFDMAKKLGAHTLDKPFALQELLDVVNELLN
jgi:CheY-like chemotaxis protein